MGPVGDFLENSCTRYCTFFLPGALNQHALSAVFWLLFQEPCVTGITWHRCELLQMSTPAMQPGRGLQFTMLRVWFDLLWLVLSQYEQHRKKQRKWHQKQGGRDFLHWPSCKYWYINTGSLQPHWLLGLEFLSSLRSWLFECLKLGNHPRQTIGPIHTWGLQKGLANQSQRVLLKLPLLFLCSIWFVESWS